MVKKYIIKINCTSIIELAYNGKIISKKKIYQNQYWKI